MNDDYTFIDVAIQTLNNGGTLLYPTDTIWGLGCDATQPSAVEKIYAIKRRDHSKSMLILCGDMAMVEHFVGMPAEEAARLLVDPSRPTTVIMPLQQHLLASNLAASDGTIGVRIPRNDFCHALLARFGRPIVSTSANFSGRRSPAGYADIEEALKRAVDYAMPPECGTLSGGMASRIVKVMSDGSISVLRD